MDKQPRKFVGILFKCCHVYTRVYINKEGTAYTGRCPKCGAQVTLKVGQGGSDSRFWTAE